ncbi:MAG: molybdopterin molybdotransferase, partial [Actinomycetota bacterium]|nr:molybdopterin molybdotransferase [Actinomycetota bacterium]
MLEVQEARLRILGGFSPLPPEELRVAEALGFVVAEDLAAPHPLPRFDNSAMDGYAVRAADAAGATEADPARLRLVGEVAAGSAMEGELAPGTAVRIMTGAPVPPGADAVVPVEVTREIDDQVEILQAPSPRAHIRDAGSDIGAGDMVVEAGTELGPGELALLASLGLSPLRVHPRPKVAVIVTGAELVTPEAEPGPGQIRDSNSLALRSLVLEAGGEPLTFDAVADDLASTEETLKRAAQDADLIVSSGGVSVGRYDFVKEAVERLGSIDFWRVAMQPGKPVVSGEVAGTPFLGLPGNPVSIHVGFEQFVRPAIRRMRGCRDLVRPVIDATLSETITKRAGRLHFVRVRLTREGDGFRATPTGAQGSHVQSSLVGCDGVARFPKDLEQMEAGT